MPRFIRGSLVTVGLPTPPKKKKEFSLVNRSHLNPGNWVVSLGEQLDSKDRKGDGWPLDKRDINVTLKEVRLTLAEGDSMYPHFLL